MAPTDDVHHGISWYIDHDRAWAAQRQWLVSDRWAIFWTNVLAIFLTYATSRFFPVLKRILSLIWPPNPAAMDDPSVELNHSTTQSPGSTSAPVLSNAGGAGSVASPTPVAIPTAIHSGDGQPLGRSGFAPNLNGQHNFGGAGFNIMGNAFRQFKPLGGLPTGQRPLRRPLVYLRDMRLRLKENFREIALGMSLGLGLVTLQAAFMALSIFSGLVVSDAVALSRSPHYGLIVPNRDNSSTVEHDKWSKRFQDLEVESVEYAKRCYPANARSEECNYFYNQSINFSVKHNGTCPFPGDVCLYGQNGAFSMTTGRILPRTIGINTRLNYQFERTTTCSPLRMDDGRFIQRHIKNGKDHFRYLFGGFGTASNNQCGGDYPNCTWDLPIEWTSKPMYRVFGTSKGPFAADMGWQPISELAPVDYTSVALLLVGNSAISYPTASHDPIFHAEAQLSDGNFYNEHAYSAVLACSDRTTYCKPDGVTCGSVNELAYRIQDDDEHRTVFTMLAQSLVHSDTGNAMKLIAGEALKAQSYVVGIGSLILAREQWKREAERLFASSLARIQITARNIARGMTGEQLPSKDLMLDNPSYREICNLYKFRSSGWKNLSVAGFIGSFLAGILLIALSLSRKDSEELLVERHLASFLKLCSKGYERSRSVLDKTLAAMGDLLKSVKFDPRQWRVHRNGQGRPRQVSRP